MAAEESELDSPSGMVTSSADVWAEGRERLSQARRRTQLFLRENPVPAIVGALGLGLESDPLPCGGLYWGHDGGILGYQTLGGATVDGRQATVMVNLYPGESDAQDHDTAWYATQELPFLLELL